MVLIWLETYLSSIFMSFQGISLGAVAEPPCHPAGHRGPHGGHRIDGKISEKLGKSNSIP